MKAKKLNTSLTLAMGFILMMVMTFSMFRLILDMKTALDSVNEQYLAQPLIPK